MRVHMRHQSSDRRISYWRFRIAALGALAVLESWACLPGSQQWDMDLTPPRVVDLSLGPPVSGTMVRDIHPADPLVVTFNEPVHPETVGLDFFVLSAAEEGEPCLVDMDCDPFDTEVGKVGGLCIRETCWISRVDQAFLNDLDDPPLLASRARSLETVQVEPDPDGKSVTIDPTTPLLPLTPYTLVISGAVRDLADNPLAGAGPVTAPVAAPFVYHFITSDPYAGCLEIRMVSPEPGMAAVPRNLPRVLVSTEGLISVEALQSLRVVVAGGISRVTGPADFVDGPCAADPARWPACYSLPVNVGLAPSARYLLVLDPGDSNDPGCGYLPTTEPQAFVTGVSSDTTPPEIAVAEPQFESTCVGVNVTSSEPVELTAQVWPAGQVGVGDPLVLYSTPEVALNHHVSLDLSVLATGSTVELIFEGRDFVGLSDVSEPLAFQVPESIPSLVITEVLANPAGSEPAQEFVEILNLSGESVNVDGWTLSDSALTPGDLLHGDVLQPGRYGLIVGPGYDPFQGQDPAPDPNAVLIHSDSSLASGGLSNSGEPVFLWDGQGRLISSYLDPLPVSASSFNGCSVERVSAEVCGGSSGWAPNLDGSSTPGRPNSHWVR